MNFILDFLKEHWRLIVEFVFLIVSLIFFLVKKKAVYHPDYMLDMIYRHLPQVINYVEQHNDSKSPLNSVEKLNCALNLVYLYLRDNFHLSEDAFDKFYKDDVTLQIENILSTPQKKGGQKNAR